jgi:hypothetical protein
VKLEISGLSAVVLVRNLQQNAEVSGELVTGLSYGDFEQAQANWNNVKEQAEVRIAAADESDEWDWPVKFLQRRGEHRFMGLRVAGRLEGLMQVSLIWTPRRKDGETRTRPLYIEYLEVAPWNLERYVGDRNRVYGRVGTQLIIAAGELSEKQGLDGRVGLHSLPTSEGFYRGLRIAGRTVFNELGLGFFEYPTLRYFETAEE